MGRPTGFVRPIGRHRVKGVGEIDDLRDVRDLAVVKAVGITAAVESFVMILRRERDVSVRMMDRLQDLVTDRRVLV